MLPIETKRSISTEISSLQNITFENERQSSTCLSPSNLNTQYHYRNANYHIPSTSVHQYRTPFQSDWILNNKMMPYKYYLQLRQYENMNNDHFHPIPSYPVSFNPSFSSVESSLSAPSFNGYSMTPPTAKRQWSELNPLLNKRPQSTYSTQKTKSDHLIESYSYVNQPYMSVSSSSSSSLSSISKRKYSKRVRQSSKGQQLSQYSNNSNESIFSNGWSSLPLPSMINTLHRSNECTYSADLKRTKHCAPLSQSDLPVSWDSSSTMTDSNSNLIKMVQQNSFPYYPNNTLEPYQTSRQCLSSDQKCTHMQKTINNCITNSFPYKLPYFLTPSCGHYYLFPSNSMPINISTGTCSDLLSELNTRFSPVSFGKNMKKEREEPNHSQINSFTQNSPIDVQMIHKRIDPLPSISKIPIQRGCLQKKSKIEYHRIKTLIKRMKQNKKLAILKFMIRKRKQQRILKKKFPETKIDKMIPQIVDNNVSKIMKMEPELPDIITSSLKITLNNAQQIESISLYYHQRHKSETKIKHSSITSNNKLDLLIEAVNFIEMHNGSSKLTLGSIK